MAWSRRWWLKDVPGDEPEASKAGVRIKLACRVMGAQTPRSVAGPAPSMRLPPTLRPGHATDRLADPVLDDAEAQWLQLAVEVTGDQPAPQQLRRRRRIVREDWLRRPLPHRRQR